MWCDVFVHVKMYEFVRVIAEDSIEHGSVVLNDAVRLFSLVNGEMCTIVSNCTDVSRTIIRSQDVQFLSLCNGEIIFGGRGLNGCIN